MFKAYILISVVCVLTSYLIAQLFGGLIVSLGSVFGISKNNLSAAQTGMVFMPGLLGMIAFFTLAGKEKLPPEISLLRLLLGLSFFIVCLVPYLFIGILFAGY